MRQVVELRLLSEDIDRFLSWNRLVDANGIWTD